MVIQEEFHHLSFQLPTNIFFKIFINNENFNSTNYKNNKI